MPVRADGLSFEPLGVVIPHAAPVRVAWTACAMAYAIEVLVSGNGSERREADAFLSWAREQLRLAGWCMTAPQTGEGWIVEPVLSRHDVVQLVKVEG